MKQLTIGSVIVLVMLLSFAIGKKVQAQSLVLPQPRDIYLHGEVTEALALGIGAAIQDLNEQGSQEITIHITSPGGSVYGGLQIYDYMKQSKAPIKTVCEGYCVSMAAFILSWGTTRSAMAHSTIMFHQVSTKTEGSLAEIINELSETSRLQAICNTITQEHSHLSLDAITKLEDHDNYMSPTQAKSLGLIDSIIGE